MKLSRRQLLQIAATSAITQYSMAGPPANKHSGSGKKHSAKTQENEDYKAMVCVFLLGGNDSWNLLIPTANEQTTGAGLGYQTYKTRRAELAVAQQALDLPMHKGKLQISTADSNPYFASSTTNSGLSKNEQQYLKGVYPIDNNQWGINGCAPELADLWHKKRLAWVVNTGVLAEPVTRATLTSAQLPLFLYAHNHQQKELAIAHALQKTRTGWAGRLADIWGVGQVNNQSQAAGINNGHLLGLNIAVGGSSPIMAAEYAPELVLPFGKPKVIKGTVGNSKQAKALNDIWQQLANSPHAINPETNVSRRNMWTSLYTSRQNTAFELSEKLSSMWEQTTDYSNITGAYGESLFDIPDNGHLAMEGKLNKQLISKLETVARLIEIGKKEGLKRQVFVVTMGGYDTHAGQAEKHPLLLRELSLGLGKFQQAMQTLGTEEQVTLFTQSDFGRTLSPNGDGTDHGWGGNQLVMGGAINSGIYGTMPDLSESSQTMAQDPRGRIIPTLAAEQTTASIAKWFGVKDQELPILFPLLPQFSPEGLDAEPWLPLFG